uniref:Putative 28 kDa metastriate family member n=1 Tax=Rhipicephalus pulchellus TaxID=72859 RepID=L7M9A7_RHIPC
MRRLALLLCFFLQRCCDGIQVAEERVFVSPWKWDNNLVKIGKNVTLEAHIFYDSNDYNTSSVGQNVTEYFTSLFRRVQQHFHNNSVMISINISKISLNQSLEVIQKPSYTTLDGNATLKNLQNYSEIYQLSNNSVVYLYTNKTPHDKNYPGAAIPGVFSTFATNGTFCSNNKSAAIVVQTPGSSSHWTTVQATAKVFGTNNFDKFKEEDIRRMQEIFSRCHVKQKK